MDQLHIQTSNVGLGNAFKFIETYWGVDKSTRVIFEAGDTLPDKYTITACFVFAVVDGAAVVMSKPERGWGLLGGHMEPGESPEACVRREAYEEGAAQLGDLTLIGWWRMQKLFTSEHNRKYPPEALQLLYIAQVSAIDPFIPQHEVTERAIVPFDQMNVYHHDIEVMEPILTYALHAASHEVTTNLVRAQGRKSTYTNSKL